MLATFAHGFRLARAGWTLMRQNILPPPPADAPVPGLARLAFRIAAFRPFSSNRAGADARIGAAMSRLGPSYIKLGQFLATRPDLIGTDMAAALSRLHDKLPPFSQAEAETIIARELDRPCAEVFTTFSSAVAAASIAQVHKARLQAKSPAGRTVAVKLLRPGIEKRFARDLDDFFFAARLVERFAASTRRLRPIASVETLKATVDMELDLRLEAAALSEMAENIKHDPKFRVPKVDWDHTSKRVLTTQWIDGIPLNDIARLKKAGHDLPALGETVIQSFLRHAMRDGFFHGDMHQGNLFVDRQGCLVAVDLGIMGRLSPKDRRFLAEILHGFITRNYRHLAQVHFDAGYVPNDQSVENFAQALRAIGEPLLDLPAEEISMGRLLEQLFQVTGQFNMQTQPQLLLLQKTMVVVEGVARSLNNRLNMWEVSEPVVREWMEQRLGPEGRIQDAAEGAVTLARFMADLPDLLGSAERALQAVGEADGGTRAPQPGKVAPSVRAALWTAAAALVVIALAQFL